MNLNRSEYNRITQKIIGSAYAVGNVLKYGYLEKVYENAMAFEMLQAGLKVQKQKEIIVRYKKR
jgi:GxxExxY protein